MGVGQLSESDAVDALRLPFYSSSHPTGSHGWRNQFDLGNPELKEFQDVSMFKVRILVLAVMAALVLLFPAVALGQPVPPHISAVSATMDGEAAADGTEITAWIDGEQVAAGTMGNGVAVIEIPGDASFTGKTISFKVGGLDAAETDTWEQGGHLDPELSITAMGQPVPPHISAVSATMEGEAAADGTEITAWIDGEQVAAGTMGNGVAVIEIPGDASFTGKTISFKVGGLDAAGTDTWEQGGHLDPELSITAMGQPVPPHISAVSATMEVMLLPTAPKSPHGLMASRLPREPWGTVSPSSRFPATPASPARPSASKSAVSTPLKPIPGNKAAILTPNSL